MNERLEQSLRDASLFHDVKLLLDAICTDKLHNCDVMIREDVRDATHLEHWLIHTFQITTDEFIDVLIGLFPSLISDL